MSIQVSLLVDDKQIYNGILSEIKKIISKNVSKIETAINNKIKQITKQRLGTNIPPISGRALYEMGVPDINERIASIIDTISNNIYVKVTPANLLQIEIGILQIDYRDILALPEAIFQFTSFRGSGMLPWLEWLLFNGAGQVIGNFTFSPIPSNYSRTGGGIMVPGGSWSIPSELAGTSTDNMFTRALTNIEKDIFNIVMQELQRNLK